MAKHRVEERPSQSAARSRNVSKMRREGGGATVSRAECSRGRKPETGIPFGVKESGASSGAQTLDTRQPGVQHGGADLQVRFEGLARDEQPHDFARAPE